MYFEYSFPAALALAVQVELASWEIAEEVIGIRAASTKEANGFYSALDEFEGKKSHSQN